MIMWIFQLEKITICARKIEENIQLRDMLQPTELEFEPEKMFERLTDRLFQRQTNLDMYMQIMLDISSATLLMDPRFPSLFSMYRPVMLRHRMLFHMMVHWHALCLSLTLWCVCFGSDWFSNIGSNPLFFLNCCTFNGASVLHASTPCDCFEIQFIKCWQPARGIRWHGQCRASGADPQLPTAHWHCRPIAESVYHCLMECPMVNIFGRYEKLDRHHARSAAR